MAITSPTIAGNRRRSGRTTRGVLQAVHACIEYAGTEIAIRDHHGTQAEHRRAFQMVRDILTTLGVGHSFWVSRCTIMVHKMPGQ